MEQHHRASAKAASSSGLTDLSEDAVRDIGGALNGLLADVFALHLKTKNFHWHMSGPHFRDYLGRLMLRGVEGLGLEMRIRDAPQRGDRRVLRHAGARHRTDREADFERAEAAVYFGGNSRIIDFPLSNALNSGIRRIAVATQYKAHSLIRHLQRGWNFFRPERNESFDILPASHRSRRRLPPSAGPNA